MTYFLAVGNFLPFSFLLTLLLFPPPSWNVLWTIQQCLETTRRSQEVLFSQKSTWRILYGDHLKPYKVRRTRFAEISRTVQQLKADASFTCILMVL